MDELELICPEGTNDTGAYRLSWSGPPETVFRLTENGEVLYEGVELATTVSGREPDEYVYRVGVVDGGGVGAWSEPCTVSVSPPSLALAFGLFGLGFAVFAALLTVIVRGHRAHRRGLIG